jgi:hypothetical protein
LTHTSWNGWTLSYVDTVFIPIERTTNFIFRPLSFPGRTRNLGRTAVDGCLCRKPPATPDPSRRSGNSGYSFSSIRVPVATDMDDSAGFVDVSFPSLCTTFAAFRSVGVPLPLARDQFRGQPRATTWLESVIAVFPLWA